MKCLNCGHIALKKHCPKCGQKTSTHRFTLSSIFDYAVLNAYLSLNAGLIFTIKELLLRPGHAVREYLQGKRAKYLNAFSLFLVMLAFSLLISSFIKDDNNDIARGVYTQLRRDYPRLMVVAEIPVLSVIMLLCFRKIKFNFAEHLVAATYLSAIILFLGALLNFFDFFKIEETTIIFALLVGIHIFLRLGYMFYFYYQLFANSGLKKIFIVLRIILAIILFTVVNLLFAVFLEFKGLILSSFLK